MKSMLLMAMVTGSLTVVGCAGVSADYVAADAATILTNSQSTLDTLEKLKCEPNPATEAGAGTEQCEIKIKQPVLDALKADQQQIRARAEALCAAAKSDCKPTATPTP